MPALKINPTRSELLKLKKRIKLAKRGHKLLKEKRDGLMSRFIALIEDSRSRRMELRGRIKKALQRLIMAEAIMGSEPLKSLLLLPGKERMVNVEKQYVMNIVSPLIKLADEGEEMRRTYGFYGVPVEADMAFSDFSFILDDLVRLAETEKMIKLMAQEVERTRRRVNALEYVLIPRFEETAKRIEMKLDEMERSSFSNLMKVKEFLEKERG